MQAFVNWVSNWLSAFFVNLQEAALGLVDRVLEGLQSIVAGPIMDSIEAASGFSFDELASYFNQANTYLGQYYPLIDYFFPFSETLSILTLYLTVWALVFPLKLTVRIMLAAWR
jgi:hypothetical protein